MTLPEITIMWFWLAIIALLCWSGSDLFSKIGCRDGRDKYNPLKMVIAVGVVMGLHAAYEIFVGGAVVTWHVIWTYLPVSLLYIGSRTLGYVGLRYIELSISSPICNSSGLSSRRRTTSCAESGRRAPTINTPSRGWRCACRWRTACSMRRVRLRTRSCSARWTRIRPTARMS